MNLMMKEVMKMRVILSHLSHVMVKKMYRYTLIKC